MLLVFKHAQFRLLWTSITISEVGIMMYVMVHGWLALSITDSPFWVGVTAGMQGLGLVSFGVIGGVIVDRVDRRLLSVATMLIMAAVFTWLAILIFTEKVQLWHVLAVAFIDGTVVSVRVPAKRALTLDVVGRKNLLSAAGADAAAATMMGIVSPLVGGLVVSVLHVGWAYLIMSCAYLVAASILIGLKRIPKRSVLVSSPWEDLKHGIRYLLATPVVRTLILMALVTEMFGWAHEIMLPVMARDVMGVGASGLGYLLAGASVGGLVSTIIVSSVGDIKKKGRLMLAGLGGFGLFLMLFAVSPWFPLSVVLLAGAYASVTAYEIGLNTLIQILVPDEMRGRVLGFENMTFGMMGVSGFHTGAIAGLLGAPTAIVLGGGIVVLNTLRLARRLSGLQEAPSEHSMGHPY